MNDRFERLLKSRIGLDASSVGSAVIERAVRQRMSGLALHDEDEYWMRLNGSPGEVQALIEAVVVPETWFFRYPESFTTLARLAFERLPSLGGGRALRILSLPCSTGEEPYSIVMALLDAGLSEYLFEVDALDVSARVIERASLGVYGRNSFRGDELGFRDRHFSEVADGYQLAEQVRRKVRFRCGNLLDPGLLAGEAPSASAWFRQPAASPSPVPSASSTKSPAWRMPASTARRAPPASANWPRVGRRPRSSTGSGCSAMSPGRSRKPRISTARPCTWSRSTPRRWRTWRRCSPLAATMPAPGACSNVRPVE